MEPITIILPIYKGREITEKCLESIRKNTKYSYKILVIADEENNTGNCDDCGGAFRDYDYLFDYEIDFLIRKKREGLISAYNLGMRISKGDVLLTQNDVEFPDLINDLNSKDCWLTQLVNKSKTMPNVGVVGCLNSVRINQPIDFVGTWCMFIPRKTIDIVGYFDEIFGWAMMDDVDYGKRIKMHRLEILREDSFEVKHLNSGTIKHLETEKMKKEALEIYKEKWKNYRDDMTDEEKKKYDFWR